jgi:hypothetical protein
MGAFLAVEDRTKAYADFAGAKYFPRQVSKMYRALS